MDIPLIRKFQCGYEQGAKYANPQGRGVCNSGGTTGAAWNDPARGGELAKAQFAKGADVVFAATRWLIKGLPGRQGQQKTRHRCGQQPDTGGFTGGGKIAQVIDAGGAACSIATVTPFSRVSRRGSGVEGADRDGRQRFWDIARSAG